MKLAGSRGSWLHIGIASGLLLFLAAGCQKLPKDPYTYRDGSRLLHKPVVAVLDFENRSGYRGEWNLGNGMADMLVTHLLDSGRFTVIERKQLQSMIQEIRRQEGEMFREEGRVALGKLKNAQFLIRGVITDFTVTGDTSAWFAHNRNRGKFLKSNARVAINMMIFDVESGEIIQSVQAGDSAGAFGIGGRIRYRDYAFGSEAYHRTPLGKATRGAMKKAIGQIYRAIPERPWRPRIAEVTGDTVIISGGTNLQLAQGDKLRIRDKSHAITNPVTGDIIQTVPGKEKGRIILLEIHRQSSHGKFLSGHGARGDLLEKLD